MPESNLSRKSKSMSIARSIGVETKVEPCLKTWPLKMGKQYATSMASSINNNKDYAFYTLSEKSYRAENQDVCFAFYEKSLDTFFFGVLDGHGKDGATVAQEAHDSLKKKIQRHKENRNDNKVEDEEKKENLDPVHFAVRKCTKLFEDIHNDIKKKLTSKAKWSGTTCTLCMLTAELLFVVNVGDSEAVHIHSLDSTDYNTFTTLHRPLIEEEQLRVEAAGGRVDTNTGRIYFQEFKLPGLAISRALGDWGGSEIGIIPTPSVKPIPLAELYSFLSIYYSSKTTPSAIVVASDGLWDFVKKEEVADLVNCSVYAEQAAKKIVKRSISKQNEKLCDNVSVVVVILENFMDRKMRLRHINTEESFTIALESEKEKSEPAVFDFKAPEMTRPTESKDDPEPKDFKKSPKCNVS
eukprot:maker-scaffold_3-snap-gene-3.7-mRNA-1 protein AED:0.61 eAED:0.68 QI:0/0/0/1/1/1/3/0/409